MGITREYAHKEIFGSLGVSEDVSASGFRKINGTANQFLMANGGVRELNSLATKDNLTSVKTTVTDIDARTKVLEALHKSWDIATEDDATHLTDIVLYNILQNADCDSSVDTVQIDVYTGGVLDFDNLRAGITKIPEKDLHNKRIHVYIATVSKKALDFRNCFCNLVSTKVQQLTGIKELIDVGVKLEIWYDTLVKQFFVDVEPMRWTGN